MMTEFKIQTNPPQGNFTGRRFFLFLLVFTCLQNRSVSGWVSEPTLFQQRNLHKAPVPIASRKQQQQQQQHHNHQRAIYSRSSTPVLFSSENNRGDSSSSSPEKNGDKSRSSELEEKRQLYEKDIKKRLSISKDRAISALSQPVSTANKDKRTGDDDSENQTNTKQKQPTPKTSRRLLPPLSNVESSQDTIGSKHKRTHMHRQGKRPGGFRNKRKVQQQQQQQQQQRNEFTGKRSITTNSQSQSNNNNNNNNSNNNNNNNNRQSKVDTSNFKSKQGFKQNAGIASYSSLLPPPLMNGEGRKNDDEGDLLALSSWEEFLGGSNNNNNASNRNQKNAKNQSPRPQSGDNAEKQEAAPTNVDSLFPKDAKTSSAAKIGRSQRVKSPLPAAANTPSATEDETNDILDQNLPSIQDLFPLDLSSTSSSSPTSQQEKSQSAKLDTNQDLKSDPSGEGVENNAVKTDTGSQSENGNSNKSPLDGVLPVSDLFYRSSQSQQQEVDDDDHDDEELPFSAEQTDAVSSDHNKIRIRRNMVQNDDSRGAVRERRVQTPVSPGRKTPLVTKTNNNNNSNNNNNNKRGRKMVRRGMEMLVGGVPINADPPQRSFELFYDAQQYLENDDDNFYSNWASVISLNTRDFGPLLHPNSIPKISKFEQGLFCEHFCHASIKWDICPKDLRQIIKTHQLQQATNPVSESKFSSATDTKIGRKPDAPVENKESQNTRVQNQSGFGDTTVYKKSLSKQSKKESKGFGRNEKSARGSSASSQSRGDGEEFYKTKGEFSFEIGVSREELESGEGGSDGGIVRSVFAKAFMSVLERAVHTARQDESENFVVEIPSLSLTEEDDGFTMVTAEFKVEAAFPTSLEDMESRMKRIGTVFTQAMDDGDIALAIAAAAKEEKRWPEAVRDKVVEECLFQDDDGDEPNIEEMDYDSTIDTDSEMDEMDLKQKYVSDDGNTQSKNLEGSHEAIFHGGGKDGVFYDFSEANALNSPYKGEIGLRLVDAVVERAKQRQPRVIAIGDVHGCIDELQDLLRECDYRPGDLVVFLGDLVCKGPDSISVVQMAREIGAIGVRGNHDFEVIRWHQAIKSGVDPPVVGSEHFHIASCLSKADMKWMHCLPWYISSKELGALFVHAGFVSGIRLAKQNPRLMMNMRSILPDGTVTSKFFNNWPWARLWDGPQTVMFGHDADRGLQQYEHALGLDTGCVYGGRLTACILPEKRLVSVSARREYFKYRRKHYD